MSTFTDRRRVAIRLSALSTLLSLSAPVVAGAPKKIPSSVLGALACMMKAHSNVLNDLLPTASPISFRYAHGDIPGTSPERGANAVNMFVYAKPGGNAVLMTAIAGD